MQNSNPITALNVKYPVNLSIYNQVDKGQTKNMSEMGRVRYTRSVRGKKAESCKLPDSTALSASTPIKLW